MIGKRRRFEIFKRDNFTCQYCGRTPPLTILEVDHIHAFAAGGGDESTNLITSCKDCNRGKASVSLALKNPFQEPRFKDRTETPIPRAIHIEVHTDDLITINEAARRLGVHRITLYRWRDLGKITFIHLGDVVCVPVAEVTQLEEKRKAVGG